MRKSLAGLIALCLGVTVTQAADAQNSSSCDSVLLTQASAVASFDRASLAWLTLVDQSNYEKAKKSAAGLTEFFVGDYSSFDQQRSRYFEKADYNATRDMAREEYKSYLDPAQIAAWRECMKGAIAIAVTYENVTPQAATVVISWSPPPAVGKLKVDNLDFGTARLLGGNPLNPGEAFDGTRIITLQRAEPGAEIRGSVSGTAGVTDTEFSAPIFVAAYVAPGKPPEKAPPHYVVNKAGQVQTSIAYWAQGSAHHSFTCAQADPGMDLIVISTHKVGLGKHPGYCVPRNEGYCDGFHEGCTDIVIDEGCLTNSDWLKWYKSKLKKEDLPYSDAAACTL